MRTRPPAESSTPPNVSSPESLAARFRRHHRTAIDSWLAAAEVLLEARETLARGEWGAFLEACCIGERTAQRMVRLARAAVKPDTVTGLGGIRATLDALPLIEELAELEDKLFVARGDITQRNETIDQLSERLAIMEEQATPEARSRLKEFIALQEVNRTQKGRINELLARINEAEGENKGLRRRLREAGVDIKP